MIVGVSPAIAHAKALVERFAPTALPILLVGARGTGKELFAEAIHRRSGRAGEFVDVDCPALPRDVADGLLFGFRRGIFTGARESHVGLIEQSHRGTLFLDELLGLDSEAQRKLLRVLETHAVRPLGERTKRALDLRVVAAVQDDVPAARGGGRLREDLYDRLRGVVIELPCLSARPEDIAPLAGYFAARQGRILGPGAPEVLRQYAWPGNVRELRHVIERAGCLVENGTLPPGAVAEAIALGTPLGDHDSAPKAATLDGAVQDAEAIAIRTALHAVDGNREAAAAHLGISPATLYRRLSVLRADESRDSQD